MKTNVSTDIVAVFAVIALVLVGGCATVRDDSDGSTELQSAHLSCIGYYALRHEDEYTEAHLFLALWHGVDLAAAQQPELRELYWDIYLDWLTDAMDMTHQEVISTFSTDSVWEVMFLSGPVITDDELREQINGDCGSATIAHVHMRELAASKAWLKDDLNEKLRNNLPDIRQEVAVDTPRRHGLAVTGAVGERGFG